MPRNTSNIRKKTVSNKYGSSYTYFEARIVVGVDPETGKTIRKSITGSTKGEVEKKLRDVQRELDSGTYRNDTKMTVGEWCETWLAEYFASSAKPLSVSTYQSRIKTHIIPAFGGKRLKELNTVMIQTWVNRLLREKKLSPKTIKCTYAILKEVLQQAIELKYLAVNPCNAVRLPRVEKKEVEPLTEDDLLLFKKTLEEIDEAYKNVFLVAVFTGMREGEICGLPWGAVNFEKGSITVKQQLQKEKEKGGVYYISTPKHDKHREIVVAPFVMDLLREVKRDQARQHLEYGIGWKNDWNLVFTNKDGSHIKPSTLLKHFKRVLEKAGISEARFHDLRHTFAVNSLQEGDDVKTVQQNLGHATAAFTLDVYGHVSERMREESARRMQGLIDRMKA